VVSSALLPTNTSALGGAEASAFTFLPRKVFVFLLLFPIVLSSESPSQPIQLVSGKATRVLAENIQTPTFEAFFG
jgi:hypothetical protein